MSCDYHRNITFTFEGVVGETKTYDPPLSQKAFSNMDITWFRKFEIITTADSTAVVDNKAITIPSGSKIKLYDFQVKGQPETRSLIAKAANKKDKIITSGFRKNSKTTKVFCIRVLEVV